MHLINMTDLFKISNLVLGRKTIAKSLYSSLYRDRDRIQKEREREPV
jgi:hypothetical protein